MGKFRKGAAMLIASGRLSKVITFVFDPKPTFGS